jgi:HD-GYP domain-containing protein (c-di-GMP phosphodiesterase class II)
MILFHHERIDGSGYPLHAKEISKESQILEVCEFLDENLCGIGCKRGKVHEVIEYMKAMSGIIFAKDVVDSVLTFTAVYPVGTNVKLSDGKVGIVIRQSEHFTDRPLLQILVDEFGNPCEEKKLLDLEKINNVVIDSVLD